MTRNTWTMRKGDLLNLDNNAKTAKGRKYGIATAIMYLAPSDVSGYQTCPMASAGCKIACLNTAGRGRMSMIQQARINRTRRFFEQRAEFMAQLEREIVEFLALCEQDGFTPAIRLNGTSGSQVGADRIHWCRWRGLPVHDGTVPKCHVL